MSDIPNTLLVWRGTRDVTSDPAFPWMGWASDCMFCDIGLVVAAQDTEEFTVPAYDPPAPYLDDDIGYLPAIGGGRISRYHVCPLCGWICLDEDMAFYGLSGGYRYVNTLRNFDVADSSLSLDELGTHLYRQFSDVYNVSWERFEDLVADVFRRTQNRAVVQSVRQKDGGADLLLLSTDGRGIDAIVECKRYAESRSVGVQLVRQLVGACVAWDVREAVLVTSSSITADATELAEHYRRSGYQIDLYGASEILSLLGCYSTQLPPLHVITEPARTELVVDNSERIRGCIVLPRESAEELDSPAFTYRRIVERYR